MWSFLTWRSLQGQNKMSRIMQKKEDAPKAEAHVDFSANRSSSTTNGPTQQHVMAPPYPSINGTSTPREERGGELAPLRLDLSDSTVVWLLLSRVNPQSLFYLHHPKCLLITSSLASSSSFRPESLCLSLRLHLPRTPPRIRNNRVVDWIRQYNAWWRGRTGGKSMSTCDLLSC